MLTIKDTTGQDTITCINYDNTEILVSGITPSIIERIIADSSIGLSSIEFQLLQAEVQANISPESYKFQVTSGSSYCVNTTSLDITLLGELISNVFVTGGSI